MVEKLKPVSERRDLNSRNTYVSAAKHVESVSMIASPIMQSI